MRRFLVIAISPLLLISFGCGGKSTINEKPPVTIEPPEPPSSLHGEALSSSSIQLTWRDNSDDEDYFAIYRREPQIDTYTVCQRVFFNTTTFTDVDLRDSTAYSYFVRAEKGDTSSRSSNSVIVTTMAYSGGGDGQITLVGALPFPGAGACIDMTGHYISTRNGMVYQFDASRLDSARIFESYQAPGPIYAIESVMGWHYLAMGESGIQSISMQYPAPAQVLGNCDTPGLATGICRVGTIPDFYYYVVDGESIQMFDGNSIPTIVGEFHNSSIPHIVDAVGDWSCVYLACGDSGIQLLDTTSPLSPTIQGHLNIAGGAGKVSLDSRTAYALQLYVLNASPNLYIIDVSIHTNLALIGAINIGNAPRAIYVDGSFVYVAYHDGLKVIDVSNPTQPRAMATFLDNHEISAVKANGDYIYIVDNNGLKILRYTPPSQ